METRVERSFLHPELSDVILFRQVVEQKLTSDFEIHLYNSNSHYKRTFNLQTKTGMSDLKEYTNKLKEMVNLLEAMGHLAEYAKWKEYHGDKLL